VETSESRKSGPLPEVPVRKPEGSPKTAPGYGTNLYSVQVTSSPSREESEALRDQFREKGYDAVVTSIDLGEQGVWYRVRVGNLANRVDAERLKKELQERFATVAKDPLIVKVSQ
jgi:cell division septation protein DedD